jgi:hypothetical protein
VLRGHFFLETELEEFKIRISGLARAHRESVDDASAYMRDAVSRFEAGVVRQLEQLGLEIAVHPI